MVKNGSITAVMTAFVNEDKYPIKTSNGSFSYRRIDENGNNQYDLLVLNSYNTVIAYRWQGSTVIYYRPYIKSHPNGDKFNKEEMKHYRFFSRTTSNQVGKFYRFMNKETHNPSQYVFVLDKVEQSEHEYLKFDDNPSEPN